MGPQLNESQLVFLAAIIPTMICESCTCSVRLSFNNLCLEASPLAGRLADWSGPAEVAALFLFCGIPWWAALTKHSSLAFLIVSYAIQSKHTILTRISLTF